MVSSSGVEFGGVSSNTRGSNLSRSVAQKRLPKNLGSNQYNSRVVKVATILFANSSSSLSQKDRSILANVHQLQRERGGSIRIVGHASSRTKDTDPVNHKMINFKVSAARAEAVAKELIRIGVDKKKLQVDAVSDSTPVFHEYMPSGEAGNRRAEIFLES